jgi:hypothetical protein
LLIVVTDAWVTVSAFGKVVPPPLTKVGTTVATVVCTRVITLATARCIVAVVFWVTTLILPTLRVVVAAEDCVRVFDWLTDFVAVVV